MSRDGSGFRRRFSGAHSQALDWVILGLFVAFVAASVRYQTHLLGYLEWGDESETVVASKMIASGMRLYSEVFNNHGPLTFLPGVFLELASGVIDKMNYLGIREHRVAIFILQFSAIGSIFLSPLWRVTNLKIFYTAAAATFVLLYLPQLYGHMYKYQVVAGHLIVMILSLLTLPSILKPNKVSRGAAILCGTLLACLPFLAITYAPMAFALFVASVRPTRFMPMLAGVLIGAAGSLVFLYWFGSFAGYLAYHFYLNAQILPEFTGLQPGLPLLANVVRTALTDGQFVFAIIAFVSVIALAYREGGVPWRSILVGAGLASLLMRGGGFQSLPYLYGLLALGMAPVSAIGLPSSRTRIVVAGMLVLLLAKVGLILPGDRFQMAAKNRVEDTEFSWLAKQLTERDDKIIAYSFQNFQYLLTERMPASGHFFHFPSQEKYNLSPKFGIKTDACKQIEEVKPKIMLIDTRVYWNRRTWAEFGGCLQRLMDTAYAKIAGKPIYVRNDIAKRLSGLWQDIGPVQLKPSALLGRGNDVELHLSKHDWDQGNELQEIGILLGTYGRKNAGVAELILESADGRIVRRNIDLSALGDNRYAFFAVPGGRYRAGLLRAETGGGIAAWEIHSNDGGVSTCIISRYSGGRLAFTPGCPIFHD